jgi:hypothetical protein
MAHLHYLDNTEFQAAGLPLDRTAARFFWALALRDAAYGPTTEFSDCFDEFLFEAGFYVPGGATRPVSPQYMPKTSQRNRSP